MNFTDLPERTKDRLRDKIRYQFVEYDEWWDAVYEDFKRVAGILGIEIKSTRDGKRDCIWFTGFCMQGSYAAYEGWYGYAENAVEKVKDYAPQDKELHRIAEELTAAQVQCKLLYCGTIQSTITGSEYMKFDTSHTNGDELDYDDAWQELEEAVEMALKDLASWLYYQLEAENDYLTGDDYLDEWLSDPDNLSSIYDPSNEEEYA